jgi:phospholipid transport system substrate-binding protein
MGVMQKKSFRFFPLLSAALLTTGLCAPAASHAFPLDVAASGFAINTAYMTVAADATQQGEGARNFIDSMAGRAIEFLGDEAMSTDAKKNSFKKLLKDSFDMNTIGRFAMGRYWRSASPQQRDEYQKLFETMVVEVYSQRFSDYQGQRFEARTYRADGEKDTIVTSFIIPDQGSEIQIDWRVRYKDGKYKVIDIIVEGVSMSVTQRSDFSSVIQRGGGNVQVLIDHLREKTKG